MSAEYETIAGAADAELEISRSRFIARLERVEHEEQAREVIARARAEHPRARHHCSAFVIGPDARVQRSNDDGEPSGTAGAPMLDALVSAGLSDVVAVVTRYFGGVLLGAGGLTRAYRSAVAEAVLHAPRVRRGMRCEVAVTSSYETAPQIEAEARRRGYAVGAADYSDRVRRIFAVAEEQVDALEALAAEASAGTAQVVSGAPEYVDLPVDRGQR
ncbi:YigZ family protein [Leucobacter triazinivorans]|uniref:YigZ family protein n=1 Tax=Leucobacter triazinivorans TaxID=1784719 RepID=A0A4P6KEI3_9MICO|nr:YigZ family protein [Leucobacter triazinivorans]QBE48767.1 YigZ family protein [Leucobacter triazinivorans]